MSKRADSIEATLRAILDRVDYTAGACRLNELVGAALPKELLAIARTHLLRQSEPEYAKELSDLYEFTKEGFARMSATLSDLKNDLALVTAGQDRETTLISGLQTSLSALQTQLAAAIADDDPAAIQAVHDGLTSVITEMSTIAPASAPISSMSGVSAGSGGDSITGGGSASVSGGTATITGGTGSAATTS
jgi:hypothetical protein